MSLREIEPGQIIDHKYRLEREIGGGGSGLVFLAQDCVLDRKVIVKLLEIGNQVDLQRFERECRSLANNKNSLLPHLYSWGQLSNHVSFIAMEFLEGQTLEDYREQNGVLSNKELIGIAIAVCECLNEIHVSGVIHRDLKPSNIIVNKIDDKFLAKLIDFGSIHLVDPEQALTSSNQIIGTVNFMSPEHYEPNKLDFRSDIFSLGCIMYSCIKPDSENLVAFIKAEKQLDFPIGVSESVRNCIRKCLELDPSKRFQSANEIISALRNTESKGTFKRVVATIFVLAFASVFFAASVPRQATQNQPILVPTSISLMADLEKVNRSHDLTAAKLLLNELENRTEYWWHGQPIELSAGLEQLGNYMACENKTELADKAYNLGLLSSVCYNEQDRALKHHYFSSIKLDQLAMHINTKTLSKEYCQNAVAFRQACEKTKLAEFKITSLCILAKIDAEKGQTEDSLSMFRQALSVECSSKLTVSDHILAAIEYLKQLRRCKGRSRDAFDLIVSETKFLKEWLSEEEITFFWERVTGFAEQAYAFALESRMPPHWAEEMHDLLRATARNYSGTEVPVIRLQLEILAAQFKHFYDRAGALEELRTNWTIAEEKREALAFQLAVNAARDLSFLDARQRSDLFRRSYDLWRESKAENKKPEQLFAAVTLAAELEGSAKYDEARPYLEHAFEHAAQIVSQEQIDFFRPKQLQMLVLAISICSKHHDENLTKEGLKQFDRLSSIPSRAENDHVRKSTTQEILALRKKFSEVQ